MSSLACRILKTSQVINQHLVVHTGHANFALPISLVTDEAITDDDLAAFCESRTCNGLALLQCSEVCAHSCMPLLTLDGLFA